MPPVYLIGCNAFLKYPCTAEVNVVCGAILLKFGSPLVKGWMDASVPETSNGVAIFNDDTCYSLRVSGVGKDVSAQ